MRDADHQREARIHAVVALKGRPHVRVERALDVAGRRVDGADRGVIRGHAATDRPDSELVWSALGPGIVGVACKELQRELGELIPKREPSSKPLLVGVVDCPRDVVVLPVPEDRRESPERIIARVEVGSQGRDMRRRVGVVIGEVIVDLFGQVGFKRIRVRQPRRRVSHAHEAPRHAAHLVAFGPKPARRLIP